MQMFTSHLLFHPPKHDIMCRFRVDSRNCKIRSVIGDDVHCHLVCPWDKHTSIEDHQRSKHLLLFLHGNSEDVMSCMSYCQWLADNLESNVLCCDYPGYGFSSGSPSEEGMNSAAFAVLDFAVTKLRYKLQDVIIMGKSIGSTPAIHIASMSYCSSLGGIILVSPVASAVRCVSGMSRLPTWLLSQLDTWMLPNIKYIGNVTCPVQFIHGTDDLVVPHQNSLALIAALRCPQRSTPLFVAAGHNNLESKHNVLFLQTLKSFLDICACRAATEYEVTDSSIDRRASVNCLVDI